MKLKKILLRAPARNNLTIFEDDIFLVSYTRSGNTWIRFILGTLIKKEGIDWKNMESGIPDIYKVPNSTLLKYERPRFIKSHEPYDNRYNKVVYLVRDVRDVIISYYNFHLKFKQQKFPIKSIDDFLDRFIEGRLDNFSRWDLIVTSWLSNKNNIKYGFLLVKYEDIRKNTFREISNILDFSGFEIIEEEINNAIEWSSFNNMKKMESNQQDAKLFKNTDRERRFLRSGNSGDWVNILNENQINKINSYFADTLVNLGYEI